VKYEVLYKKQGKFRKVHSGRYTVVFFYAIVGVIMLTNNFLREQLVIILTAAEKEHSLPSPI
jgi:hypothetical protein